jgi:hypothetical protein
MRWISHHRTKFRAYYREAVENLERMSNENYELNPDPHMDMGLASARAVLAKYEVRLNDTGA